MDTSVQCVETEPGSHRECRDTCSHNIPDLSVDKSSEMSSVCPSPPRLASLTKWDNFPGYGFNLHAEKARAGGAQA